MYIIYNYISILTRAFVHLCIMNAQTAEYGKSFERRHIAISERITGILKNDIQISGGFFFFFIRSIQTIFRIIIWV